MKKREMTPAEREEERRRKEAEWWKKVITYYLYQFYQEQMDREAEKYPHEPLIVYMAGYIRERRLMHKLYEKEAGKLSAFELLEKMQKFQEEDSPFRRLYNDLKENPPHEDKINESITRCVEVAPENILKRRRRNGIHIRNHGKAAEKAGRVSAEEEQRTKYEMTFLRAVMPPELFHKLCAELSKEGREIDPEKDFLFVPEQEGPSYEEYVAQHVTDPREKEGRLGNLDEFCTSAAYMLAAYEQKNAEQFDERRADARAMEISGSKAFRTYMMDHPGSILAAARNTGIENTHQDLMALDAALKQRDTVLGSVRDAMKTKAMGRTGAYHQLMNALDRFVSSPDNPSAQEKSALSMKLAQFIMTEGNPGSLHYDKATCVNAARALKALLPKKDFDSFLETANVGRSKGDQLKAEELEGPAPRAQEAPAPEGPVLERRNP